MFVFSVYQDGQVCDLLTLGLVCLVHQCRKYMTIFYVEVVIGTKDVCWNDCCVTMTELLEVRSVNTQTVMQGYINECF